MCTAHSTLLLAASAKGYIRVCAGCAHLQLLFGNLFLSFSLAEMMQLRDCLTGFPPAQFQDTAECGPIGVIRAGEARYALSPEDMLLLTNMITEAYVMIQTYEILYTK